MSVEILTVSLSDESIERLAHAVAMRMTQHRSPVTTDSNPPSSQNSQDAERSGFQSEGRAPESDGPWTNNAPPQQERQAPQQNQQAQDGPPTCKCGQPKKWVPPGFSKNTGKSYQGFWACPQARGNQCPRD